MPHFLDLECGRRKSFITRPRYSKGSGNGAFLVSSRRSAVMRERHLPLRQRPERAEQAEVIEYRLVFVAASWSPVCVEACVPPGVCEVAKGLRWDGRTGFAGAEPPSDVFFRPEEIHGASGEHDVVPPVRGRDEAVKQEVRTIGLLSSDLEGIGLAAVGA